MPTMAHKVRCQFPSLGLIVAKFSGSSVICWHATGTSMDGKQPFLV
jgi:hypothetical protein